MQADIIRRFKLRSLKCESGSTSFSTLMRIALVPSVHSASRNYLSVFRRSSWSAPRWYQSSMCHSLPSINSGCQSLRLCNRCRWMGSHSRTPSSCVKGAHPRRCTFTSWFIVVQWSRLGTDNFLLAYGLGLFSFKYAQSPLEQMALHTAARVRAWHTFAETRTRHRAGYGRYLESGRADRSGAAWGRIESDSRDGGQSARRSESANLPIGGQSVTSPRNLLVGLGGK